MKASELIRQLRDVPDHVNLAVRLDLSTDDEATQWQRAEGRELIEVMKVRDVTAGQIVDACVFVGDCEMFGFTKRGVGGGDDESND